MKQLQRNLVVTFCLILSGCISNGTEEVNSFSGYLNGLGYSFHNPPRTDRGPSSVFRFEKTNSGAISVVPVCKQLFQNIEISEAVVALPRENNSEMFELNVAFSMLDKVLENPASAQSSNLFEKDVETEFTGTKALSVSSEDLYNEDGSARTITPGCLQALKRLSSEKKLDKDVFIVQESIRVDSVKYKFKKNIDSNNNAEFSIKDIFKISPSAKYKYIGQNTIEVEQPIYVAFKAFRLKSFVETGLTSSGSAVIKFERE